MRASVRNAKRTTGTKRVQHARCTKNESEQHSTPKKVIRHTRMVKLGGVPTLIIARTTARDRILEPLIKNTADTRVDPSFGQSTWGGGIRESGANKNRRKCAENRRKVGGLFSVATDFFFRGQNLWIKC